MPTECWITHVRVRANSVWIYIPDGYSKPDKIRYDLYLIRFMFGYGYNKTKPLDIHCHCYSYSRRIQLPTNLFNVVFFFFFLWWCLRSGAWVVLLLEKENKGYSKIYGEMTRSKIWWKISCMLILSLWIMTNSFVCYAIFMMKSLEM